MTDCHTELERPDCFDFAMDFLGDPEAPELLRYIEALEARVRTALAQPETPSRLHHCPTHGQQPENAWGCPECVREMRQQLAQPEPEGPISESELAAMWNQQADAFNQWESLDSGEQLAWAQARALARYARPTIKPVPVSERLPGAEDCDKEGRCWWFNVAGVPEWQLAGGGPYGEAWLPHHALPIPATY